MKEMNIHSKTIINKTWNPGAGRFEHTFIFAFQTKAEYLEFRQCWKESYAAFSESIRELKSLIRATMRQRDYAGKHQSELHAQKAVATVQLAMLRSAKLEANRQYLAAKEVAR